MRQTILYSIAAAFAILSLWQGVILITEAPRYILPAPLAVMRAFIEHFSLIAHHSAITLSEVLYGLVIGIALGVVSALMLEISTTMRLFLRPILIFSQAIPVFALAPVLTLWLGYGMISKVVMAVLIIFFPVTSAFYDGLCKTPRGFFDLAHTLDAKPIRLLLLIKIPSALPSLFSGMRLAAVYAPIGAIIGEWVGSSEGLGYLMLLANGRVKTDLMFAALICLGCISMLLYGIMSAMITHFGKKYSQKYDAYSE